MTKDQITAYRLRGWTLSRIAEKAGLTPARISQITMEAGVPASGPGVARGTIRCPKVKELVWHLRRSGSPSKRGGLKALAEKFDLNYSYTGAVVRRFRLGLYD